MMDEAFLPFSQILEKMLSFNGELIDEQEGIHFHIYACEIESPVELDIYQDEQGEVHIGSTPPLYYVDTSFRPSFHKLKFTAERSEVTHGE